MKHFAFLGLILAATATVFAQTLPPGQLPPGPPPQPGQIGPAPKKLPPGTDTLPPNAGTSDDVPAPTANAGTIPGVTIHNVLVPTSVLDPDGHGYVNGLQASDFEVYDNDKLQKITAEITEQPLSLVLVVQANSEIEPVLPQLRRTGLLFHGLVTGETGDVAVLAFDHRLQLLQDFTNDPGKLDDAMQKLTSGSRSARMIDAVMDASRRLKQHDPRNERRRVIVLLSRNIDRGSETRLQEAVHTMQFDNVIIYSIDISRVLTSLLKQPDFPRPANGGIPPEALPNAVGATGPRTQTSVAQEQTGNLLNAVPPVARAVHDLFRKTPSEAFAYFTAGRVYSFATRTALESAVADIGADLNSQYVLSYKPNDENEPGFHNIRVVVNRPGLRIRARPGYWWGGGVQ